MQSSRILLACTANVVVVSNSGFTPIIFIVSSFRQDCLGSNWFVCKKNLPISLPRLGSVMRMRSTETQRTLCEYGFTCWTYIDYIPAQVALSGTKMKSLWIVLGWNSTLLSGLLEAGSKIGVFWSLSSTCGCTTVTGISNSGPFCTQVVSYALTLFW